MTQQSLLLDGSMNDLEIVEFYITEELPDGSSYTSYYGMNVAKVLEIIRYPEPVAAFPGQNHPAVLGSFNLRDRVMPLVDLELWLEKKPFLGKERKIMVTEFSNVVTAFVVSGVTRIYRISWANVEPAGKHLQSMSDDIVIGIVRLDEKIIFLLDMEHIMSTLNPDLRMDSVLENFQHDPKLGQGHRILVADDSAIIRKTITHMLSMTGYEVFQTDCGREAWELLEEWKKTAKERGEDIFNYVDLVVSDIEMPEMDGHTLTRKIRSDPALKDLPVILFSSLISDVVREKGVAAGANDQIAKPDLPELGMRVKKLIEERKAGLSSDN